VHATDWYDKNQCHSTNPDVHDKTLGRIFKIRHEADRWVQVDLKKMSSDALVDLQLHRNDWYVRHARRILQERGADPKVHAKLKGMLRDQADVTRTLRAMWALHATEGLREQDLLELLGHDSEYVRSWAVYLLVQAGPPSEAALRRFAGLARQDVSPLVRLYLASALQRVPPAKRWDIVAALAGHAEDADDLNQPLMVWYAAEPLAEVDMSRALALALESKLPRLFSFTVQRIAAIRTQDALRALTERLGRTENPSQQTELLDGISQIVKKK
jgi:hypothetical protein